MDLALLAGAVAVVTAAVGSYYGGFELKKQTSSMVLASLVIFGLASFAWLMLSRGPTCDSDVQDCPDPTPAELVAFVAQQDAALTRGLVALLAISVPGIA